MIFKDISIYFYVFHDFSWHHILQYFRVFLHFKYMLQIFWWVLTFSKSGFTPREQRKATEQAEVPLGCSSTNRVFLLKKSPEDSSFIRILYFSNSETLKKSASFSLSLWIRPKWKSFARRQPCVIWEGQLLGCFKKIAPKSCLQVLSTEQRAKAKASQAVLYDSRASTWSDVLP